MISLFLGFNGIFILLRAVWARNEGAVISLSGIGCVVIGAVLDVLNSYGYDSLPQNSTAMGMSICIICQSQIVALRFASAFRRSEHLSRELQSEVAMQTRDIKSILAHIRQGIFTISTTDKTIDELHSEYLKDLTHQPQMKGQTLRTLILDRARLSEEEKSLTESSLDAAWARTRSASNSMPRILSMNWSSQCRERRKPERFRSTGIRCSARRRP
ncbi:MAG TPA: hypothetical protein VFO10_13200 [Oligoflexus sp.]|uniref:hypothetical protein n=1 Tax=Oligoflexus sp. TaxID=1971216 RepID=UPI002D7F2E41|nr:hypothetical protein [Oligoflexus sp.]HET9238210.1 hypothetical protein [Oligoflexus sp.]